MNVVYHYIEQYLDSFKGNSFCKEYSFFKEQGRSAGIPLISLQTGQFLYMISSLIKPENILEIGTGTGCSAFFLKKGFPQSNLITYEKDSLRFDLARKILGEIGISCEILHSDFLNQNTPAQEGKKFYLVFIDGMKREYGPYLDKCTDLIPEGGIVILDNVLFNGCVANRSLSTDKTRSAAQALDDFLATVTCYPFLWQILPVGDGILWGIRR